MPKLKSGKLNGAGNLATLLQNRLQICGGIRRSAQALPFRDWLITISIIVLGLAACLPGKAVFAAATIPDAGSVLDSVQQPENQPPAATAPGDITINQPETAPPSDNPQKIRVNGFRFSGETIVPEKELFKLIAAQTGRELTLTDLDNLAARITQYLRRKGYPVAGAYIPAQHVKDGIVAIAVVPGKYGEIKLNNAARLDNARLRRMSDALKPGAIITQKSLERVLLLLNDLAGVSARATLRPGQAPGTADLCIDVADSAPVNGNINADNRGSRYTGQYRGDLGLTLNNLTRNGDGLNLGGLTSGDKLANINCGYGIPLGADGLRFDLNYSTVHYTLGEDFASLDATGRADVYHAGWRYPLIRGRTFNLYGAIGWDTKQLRDEIASAATTTPRRSDLWDIGLSGDWTGGGGANAFGFAYYGGNLGINDAAATATDAAGANTAGYFHKYTLDYSRRQYLGRGLELNLQFGGQLTDKNLDSSEKFTLGGGDGLRAYPQGEAAGDEGYRLTAEVQWRIPRWSTDHRAIHMAFFSDYGYAVLNKIPWDGAANSRSLWDAGLGFIWTVTSGFYLRCDYAWKIGSESARSDTDQAGRFWLRMAKRF